MGRLARLVARTAWLTAILLPGLCILGSPALAQVAPAPSVRQSIDQNGVDLFLGTMNVDGPALSAGQNDVQGLIWRKFNRGSGWGDNMVATLTVSGTTVHVSFGGKTDRFTVLGSSYIPTDGNGASLSLSGTAYTYTGRDGMVAQFNGIYVRACADGNISGLIMAASSEGHYG